MLRRNIRLRREYLYRKSLEGKERLLYEKKRKIKEALQGLPFFFLIKLTCIYEKCVSSFGLYSEFRFLCTCRGKADSH